MSPEVLEERGSRVGLMGELLVHSSPQGGTPHTRGKMPVSTPILLAPKHFL